MSQQENNGLDFEVSNGSSPQHQSGRSSLQNDPDLKKVFRKSFRLPLDKKNPMRVHVGNSHYDLINMVAFEKVGIGIGVRVSQKEDFSLGDELTSVQFDLGEKHFNVIGKVRHISPEHDGAYICGIELIHLDEKDLDALKSYIQKYHDEMFSGK